MIFLENLGVIVMLSGARGLECSVPGAPSSCVPKVDFPSIDLL